MADTFNQNFLGDVWDSIKTGASTAGSYWSAKGDDFLDTTKTAFGSASTSFSDMLKFGSAPGPALVFGTISGLESAQKTVAAANGKPAPDTVAAAVVDWTSEKLTDARITKDASIYAAVTTGKAVSNTVTSIAAAVSADSKPSLPLWLKLTIGASLVLGVVTFVKAKA